MDLPALDPQAIRETRDYLHDAARTLGALQLALVPAVKHDWHYGLIPSARGLVTQTLRLGNGQEVVGRLDFQAGSLKLGRDTWPLLDFGPLDLVKKERTWLEQRGITQAIKMPPFGGTGKFDLKTARQLGQAFWRLAGLSVQLKAKLTAGLTSPLLVYPHHFDLSLAWFPWGDERQLSFGFSPGDEMIAEPYLYVTAWPEPPAFCELTLPDGAYWQQTGFSGAILPYAELRRHHRAPTLLQEFAEDTLRRGRELL